MARRTPLFDRHLALGARMVDFGGWDMPLQYSGMREEHLAVRQRAGLFDVSHMGEVRISGADREPAVQRLVTNDLARIAPGRSMYTVMCTEQGGIVDDLIVYRSAEEMLVVVNAACREKDVAWMRDHLEGDAALHDASDEVALLALQGPLAQEVLATLTDADLGALRAFSHVEAHLAGIDAELSVVSRTGYTGEDGFELFIDASHAAELWDAVLHAGRPHGVLPAGLGARDTLRLEAGLRLYGQDMDEDVDPLSAGLGWTVKHDKGDFIGAAALRALRDSGPPRRMTGLQLEGRSIARHGMAVRDDGRDVGEVTSGTFSFTLGHGIATALVDREAAGRQRYEVDIRGAPATATAVPLPFYRRPKT